MNRQERRREKMRLSKFAKSVDKLTDRQVLFMKEYANQESEKTLKVYKQLVDRHLFAVMRENKISEERIARVMEEANKRIIEEVNVVENI